MYAPVTTLFAALHAVLYLVLSLVVIRLRQTTGVPIGDGGQHALKRAIRVHANFAEYVPIALVLMLLVELAGEARMTVVCGAMLLAGRLGHAWGLGRHVGVSVGRFGGTTLTFLAIGLLSLVCLRVAFAGLG